MNNYSGEHKNHREKQMHLWRCDKPLTSPPKKFDKDRMYRIMLAYAVPAHPENLNGHMLRPADRVVVNGEFAETIKAAIISVAVVG